MKNLNELFSTVESPKVTKEQIKKNEYRNKLIEIAENLRTVGFENRSQYEYTVNDDVKIIIDAIYSIVDN